MKLNPDNPVTQQMDGNWHKLVLMLMLEMGVTEFEVTTERIDKMVASPYQAVVADARGGRFVLRAVTMEQGQRMAAEQSKATAEPAPQPKPKQSDGHVTDPDDPRLTRGVDDAPTKQAEVYLVLSEEERAKGFVRPVRHAYVHKTCGGETRMSTALAETYARDPKFYGATYCVHCNMHRPVAEFVWSDTDQVVGS